MGWFGLLCLKPLSTLFQLYRGTGVPRENHRPVASHWQTLSHNVVSSTPPHERGSRGLEKTITGGLTICFISYNGNNCYIHRHYLKKEMFKTCQYI